MKGGDAGDLVGLVVFHAFMVMSGYILVLHKTEKNKLQN